MVDSKKEPTIEELAKTLAQAASDYGRALAEENMAESIARDRRYSAMCAKERLNEAKLELDFALESIKKP